MTRKTSRGAAPARGSGSKPEEAGPDTLAPRLHLAPDELLELATQLGVEASELERAVAETALDELTAERAAALLAEWYDDPVAFVISVFRPTPTVFAPDGIDLWQKDALISAVHHPRVAMKACKGPGKSCVLAWLIWWFLTTRRHANVVVTSITGDNLKDGLWKELGKWYARAPYLQRIFKFTGERITYRAAPMTWWCSARGWAKDADPEQQANTMAGLHGEHVMVVHDEVSDYPDGVLAASEGIFATLGQEAKLIIAGNPTRQDGPLYRVCTRDRKLWKVIEITGDPDDPKRSPRLDVEVAKAAIAQHGRDHPWVMTNILGLFPKVASDKLLGPDQVTKAVCRDVPPAHYVHEPFIMGLDVAWDGDDQSVLIARQGDVVFRPKTWRSQDPAELADQVAMVVLRQKRKPDAIFVDVIGIGAGVYANLRRLLRGYDVREHNAGSSPMDPRYLNRRAECWHLMADAVRKRVALPDVPQLRADLVGPKVKMTDGGGKTFKLALEKKADMKKRGLPSPDFGDALAMTWSEPVLAALDDVDDEPGSGTMCQTKYDPFAGL